MTGGRLAGVVLTAAGVLTMLTGVAGMALSAGEGSEASPQTSVSTPGIATATTAAQTTLAPPPSSTTPATTRAPVPTEVPAATSTATSGTPAPTTTSAVAPTTRAPVTTVSETTVPPSDRVLAFVEFFTSAIAAGDTDGLMATLHPAVITAFGEDVCRSFTEREILALEDYSVVGPISGPFTRSLDTGGGSITITDVYEASVRFTYQGQVFEATSDFVVADTVSWLAVCR